MGIRWSHLDHFCVEGSVGGESGSGSADLEGFKPDPTLLTLAPHIHIHLCSLQESLARATRLIEDGVKHGAKLELDGRGIKVPGYEKGNFLGPTILSGLTAANPAYSEEIFAPVLGIVTVRG